MASPEDTKSTEDIKGLEDIKGAKDLQSLEVNSRDNIDSLGDVNNLKNIDSLEVTTSSDSPKSKTIAQHRNEIMAGKEQTREIKAKTDQDALFVRFKSLPIELLLNILRLDIQHSMVEDCLNGTQLPMILQVLGRKPDKIYADLLHEYNRTHAQLHSYNVVEFNKQKLKGILQLKHLTIIFPLGKRRFTGQKITCMNNLESVFFDFSLDQSEHNKLVRLPDEKARLAEELEKEEFRLRKVNAFTILRWLILANSKAMKRVAMRVKMEKCAEFMQCGTQGLHLTPLVWQKDGFRYFIWETKSGFLTWNQQVFEPDVKTMITPN